MDNPSKDDSIYYARLSEQGERYDDMIKYMKIVAKVSLKTNLTIKSGQEMTNDERNLLSVAYKNSVKTRRDAWRTITAIQNKEELKVSEDIWLMTPQGNNKFLPLIVEYKTKIEDELSDYCNQVINLLEQDLVPATQNPEAIVFYLKMKGDYFRYLGEYKQADEKKKVIDKA